MSSAPHTNKHMRLFGVCQRCCGGHPDGNLALYYLRVSTEEQAEQGRSGLALQIVHCHDIASCRRLPNPLFRETQYFPCHVSGLFQSENDAA
jgi:hypothetical protein